MKTNMPIVRAINLAAKNLADPRYRPQIVRDKKKHSRKGKTSSKKFEDSIQSANGRGLIEFGGYHDGQSLLRLRARRLDVRGQLQHPSERADG